MKIEVDNNRQIVLKEVFNGIILESADKETISICMRDSGFEFNYQGVWYEAKEGVVRKMGESPATKVQELLNDKGLELTKGKVLDSDGFKIGASEVHVIYIADDQKLIDKFKIDVTRLGVTIKFTPTAKESYEGDKVKKNPFYMDEIGTTRIPRECEVPGCSKPVYDLRACKEHFDNFKNNLSKE